MSRYRDECHAGETALRRAGCGSDTQRAPVRATVVPSRRRTRLLRQPRRCLYEPGKHLRRPFSRRARRSGPPGNRRRVTPRRCTGRPRSSSTGAAIQPNAARKPMHHMIAAIPARARSSVSGRSAAGASIRCVAIHASIAALIAALAASPATRLAARSSRKRTTGPRCPGGARAGEGRPAPRGAGRCRGRRRGRRRRGSACRARQGPTCAARRARRASPCA